MWDFDGYTWTAPRVPYPTPRPFDALDNEVAYSETVEPHGKRWLFALDLPLRTPARASMTSDFQILFQSPLTNRLRYDMLSTLRYRDRSELPRYEMQRALRLPGDGNPRARAMAADMRKRTVDDRAYINMVLAMFRNDNFSYTTTPPLLRADPVDEFLLSTRAGYCEHYASAFTFLMRAGGVPARVVTGYQGGEFNTFSNYMIVRQADAHAWSEVWLKDSGWTRVDPTAAVSPARVQTGVAAAVPQNEQLPLMLRGEYRWLHGARLTWDLLANSWNQLVLGYTMDNQRQLMQRIGISDATWQTLVIVMMLTTGVVTLALALLLLLSFRRSRPDPVIAAYARFCRRLANRGVTRHPSEGPDAFCKRAAAIRPEIAAAIGSISRLYVHLRYGREAGSDEITELKRAVAVFRA
jgi:transglutaminase-like putative cysteine protease